MNCPVCQEKMQGVQCPRCGFVDVLIPIGDQCWTSKQGARLNDHRKALLARLQLAVPVTYWKVENDRWVKDREERLPLCSAGELSNGKQMWLSRKFAETDEGKIQQRLWVGLDGKPGWTVTAEFDNVPKGRMYQLGIEIDDQCRFRLLLTQNAAETNPKVDSRTQFYSFF